MLCLVALRAEVAIVVAVDAVVVADHWAGERRSEPREEQVGDARGHLSRTALASHRMAWHGMAWHGMACHGMAWHGIASHAAVLWWHGVGERRRQHRDDERRLAGM